MILSMNDRILWVLVTDLKKITPIFEIKMIWKHWLQMDWITENYSVVLDNLEI